MSVSFTPNRQGYVNFRVLLKVKRMLEPLALTVKAECFSMSTLVQVEKPSGGFKELKPNHFDSLDFEKVRKMQCQQKKSTLKLVLNVCSVFIILGGDFRAILLPFLGFQLSKT